MWSGQRPGLRRSEKRFSRRGPFVEPGSGVKERFSLAQSCALVGTVHRLIRKIRAEPLTDISCTLAEEMVLPRLGREGPIHWAGIPWLASNWL